MTGKNHKVTSRLEPTSGINAVAAIGTPRNSPVHTTVRRVAASLQATSFRQISTQAVTATSAAAPKAEGVNGRSGKPPSVRL